MHSQIAECLVTGGMLSAQSYKNIGGLYTLAWNISDKKFGFVSAGHIKNFSSRDLRYLSNRNDEIFGTMSLTIKATVENNHLKLRLCQNGYHEAGNLDHVVYSLPVSKDASRVGTCKI